MREFQAEEYQVQNSREYRQCLSETVWKEQKEQGQEKLKLQKQQG